MSAGPQGYPPILTTNARGRSLAQRERDAAVALAQISRESPAFRHATDVLAEEVHDAVRLRGIVATARLIIVNHLDMNSRSTRALLLALDGQPLGEITQVINR